MRKLIYLLPLLMAACQSPNVNQDIVLNDSLAIDTQEIVIDTLVIDTLKK